MFVFFHYAKLSKENDITKLCCLKVLLNVHRKNRQADSRYYYQSRDREDTSLIMSKEKLYIYLISTYKFHTGGHRIHQLINN